MKTNLKNFLKERTPLTDIEEKVLTGRRGKYRVVEIISCCGNSLIYEAERLDDKEKVIIKEIYPYYLPGISRKGNGEISGSFAKSMDRMCLLVERSRNEIDIIDKLPDKEGKYTNYVDFSADGFEQHNTFYSVGYFRDYQPLPEKADLPEALWIVRRILEALLPLHEAKLLHLDISPGNVIQTNIKDGEKKKTVLKLIDLSSSYWLSDIENEEGSLSFTLSGDFTAPEIRGGYYDENHIFSADLYSVGKVFCHLIGVERTPFDENIIEADSECCKGIGHEAISLSNEIIIKALDSDPGKRYESVSEMIEAVDKALECINKRQHETWEKSEYVLVRQSSRELIALDSGILVVGRASGNKRPDYSISSDNEISREHFVIKKQDGEFFISDCNSKNGTFLNEKRLLPNDFTRLDNGDKIRISTEYFVFLLKPSGGDRLP